LIGLLILSAAMSGCGGGTGVTYSEEAIQEWLGICMEGPSYEAFCRCEAEVVVPFADEALFLEHIRSGQFLIPVEATDAQDRLCAHLEPVLRADGVAGVAFGMALEPALTALVEVFGEGEVVEASECAATVAAWDGLRLTFSSTGSLVGWAYGAFQAGDDADPLGIHAELSSPGGTLWLYTGSTSWSTYADAASDPVFVADDPPTLVLTGEDGPEEQLRVITAGKDPADPIVRLEAGTVCPPGP
jgi:hypothetical protein